MPAGVVDRIDRANEKVFVRMTKDQVKNAPDFEDTHRDRRGTEYDTYYDRTSADRSTQLRLR